MDDAKGVGCVQPQTQDMITLTLPFRPSSPSFPGFPCLPGAPAQHSTAQHKHTIVILLLLIDPLSAPLSKRQHRHTDTGTHRHTHIYCPLALLRYCASRCNDCVNTHKAQHTKLRWGCYIEASVQLWPTMNSTARHTGSHRLQIK